jgi:hypothetical protein
MKSRVRSRQLRRVEFDAAQPAAAHNRLWALAQAWIYQRIARAQ